jgi:hypothetical protein
MGNIAYGLDKARYRCSAGGKRGKPLDLDCPYFPPFPAAFRRFSPFFAGDKGRLVLVVSCQQTGGCGGTGGGGFTTLTLFLPALFAA